MSRSFLDLPYELRRQIYRECFSLSAAGSFIAQLPGDVEDMRDVSRVNPHIGEEMLGEWWRACDTVMRFLVTAEPWEPPAPIYFPNIENLMIEFERYPYEAPLHSDTCVCSIDKAIQSRREEYLNIMQTNLRRFVTWFNASNNQSEQFLYVRFQGDIEADPCWCKRHVDIDGAVTAITLATRPKTAKRREAVIEYLLHPLQDMPVVPKATVCELWDLTEIEELREASIASIFEENYCFDLCSGLADWLQGNRDVPWDLQLWGAVRRQVACTRAFDQAGWEHDARDADAWVKYRAAYPNDDRLRERGPTQLVIAATEFRHKETGEMVW